MKRRYMMTGIVAVCVTFSMLSWASKQLPTTKKVTKVQVFKKKKWRKKKRKWPPRPPAIGMTAAPAPVDKMPKMDLNKTSYRVILVGDTGYLKTQKACLGNPHREAVRKSMIKENADFYIVLGDLVYYTGPECEAHQRTPTAQQMKIMDARLGGMFKGIKKPIFLALGNHDLGFKPVDFKREACLLYYAAKHPYMYLPAPSYIVKFKHFRLVMLNTNTMSRMRYPVARYMAELDGRAVRKSLDGYKGFTLFAAHHGLRTFFNKERENYVLPWLKRHGLVPDLFASGHAHFLQFGLYGKSYLGRDIPAVTSGSGAKLRCRSFCYGKGKKYPAQKCIPTKRGCRRKVVKVTHACGPKQLWGVSKYGYAVVDITKDKKIDLFFKDKNGALLYKWTNRAKKPVTTQPTSKSAQPPKKKSIKIGK